MIKVFAMQNCTAAYCLHVIGLANLSSSAGIVGIVTVQSPQGGPVQLHHTHTQKTSCLRKCTGISSSRRHDTNIWDVVSARHRCRRRRVFVCCLERAAFTCRPHQQLSIATGDRGKSRRKVFAALSECAVLGGRSVQTYCAYIHIMHSQSVTSSVHSRL